MTFSTLVVVDLLDPLVPHPLVYVVGMEADEFADLVERDATLLNEAADKPFCHTKLLRKPSDVEKARRRTLGIASSASASRSSLSSLGRLHGASPSFGVTSVALSRRHVVQSVVDVPLIQPELGAASGLIGVPARIARMTG